MAKQERSPLLLIAPVELAYLGRTAFEIPVAAKQPKARFVGPRDDDVRRDPVFAVADDDVAVVLAAHRPDRAVDDLLDLDDARLALRLIDDRHLPRAEKAAGQDFEQPRRAAGAACHDPGERLGRLHTGLVV